MSASSEVRSCVGSAAGTLEPGLLFSEAEVVKEVLRRALERERSMEPRLGMKRQSWADFFEGVLEGVLGSDGGEARSEATS